jgi:hypothetical protein
MKNYFIIIFSFLFLFSCQEDNLEIKKQSIKIVPKYSINVNESDLRVSSIPDDQKTITFIRGFHYANPDEEPSYQRFWQKTFDISNNLYNVDFSEYEDSQRINDWSNKIYVWTSLADWFVNDFNSTYYVGADPHIFQLHYQEHAYNGYVELNSTQTEYVVDLKMITGEILLRIDISNFSIFDDAFKPTIVDMNIKHRFDNVGFEDSFIYEDFYDPGYSSQYTGHGYRHENINLSNIDSFEGSTIILPVNTSDYSITVEFRNNEVKLLEYFIDGSQLDQRLIVESAKRTIINLPEYTGPGTVNGRISSNNITIEYEDIN